VRIIALFLLFLALAGDAAAVKPPQIYLPHIQWRDPLCGYYEPLDRWWCYRE
jgi:hypothetical protein